MITWTIWFTCPQHGNNGSRLHKEDPVGNSSEFEARVLRHSAALMLLYYSPILSKIFILLFEKKLISIIKIFALSSNNSIEIRKICNTRTNSYDNNNDNNYYYFINHRWGKKMINDTRGTKKVENDFAHPPIPRGGKKMKPFRWQERRHVPIDRFLIRKHVNQRKYPRGILLAVSYRTLKNFKRREMFVTTWILF